jgi:hypothetical protein
MSTKTQAQELLNLEGFDKNVSDVLDIKSDYCKVIFDDNTKMHICGFLAEEIVKSKNNK